MRNPYKRLGKKDEHRILVERAVAQFIGMVRHPANWLSASGRGVHRKLSHDLRGLPGSGDMINWLARHFWINLHRVSSRLQKLSWANYSLALSRLGQKELRRKP